MCVRKINKLIVLEKSKWEKTGIQTIEWHQVQATKVKDLENSRKDFGKQKNEIEWT